MVVHQKGFFLRNFEKIISAVIALFILVALGYVVNVNRAVELKDLLDRIEESKVIIDRGAGEPPEETIPPYESLWAKRTEVRSPEEFASVFWPSFPEYYPEFVAGTGREYVLEFTDPIYDNTIEIEVLEGENVLSLEDIAHPHPLYGDESRMVINTGSGEGRVRVVAKGGGKTHIREIVTDEAIDVPPSPPLNLAAKFTRGRKKLHFEHNPENEEGVVVEEYEIFRKRARDILSSFELVDTVTVQADELSSDAREALREAGKSPAESRDAVERDIDIDIDAEGVLYVWEETDVNPEELYLYKVRTVGLKSNPRRSDFTDLLRVETLPTNDFRLWDFIGDELEFELAFETDRVMEKVQIENVLGDRVGISVEDRNEDYPIDTSCLIIDFHSQVRRIIYVDPKKRIKSLSRDFWRTGSDDDYPWEPEDIADEETREEWDRDPELDPYGGFRDPD